MEKPNKQFWSDIIKTVLVALIFCAICILGVTLLLNFVPMEEKILSVVNLAVKILSLVAACIFGFKDKKQGLVKGAVCGLGFGVLSFLLYGITGGNLSFDWTVVADIGLQTAVGMIGGVLAVTIASKS